MLMAMNYSHNTLKNYTGAFITFLRAHAYQNPETIDRRTIVAYLAGLSGMGLTSASGHTIVNALKYYFRHVLQWDDIDSWSIPRPKKEKKLPVILTVDECKRVLDTVMHPKHKLILLLAYGSGLRVSEICHLTWGAIDFKAHRIRVISGKGKKDRNVMLPYAVVDYFETYRTLYKPGHYVFEGQVRGEPYSTSSCGAIMRRAVRTAGIGRKVGIHGLRHSFATHLLEGGTDIRFIQKLLGHTSIKTTTIYTHVSRRQTDKIVSPLDRMQQNDGLDS